MSFDVAVIGAGVVGGGVVQTLLDATQTLANATGVDIRLSHVCEINQENLAEFDLSGVVVTDDAGVLNTAPDVKVVCELIGGIEPAKTFIINAMKAGKHVVTANKMLIAYHGPELTKIAIENGVQLRYEAAVAGAIPIIKSLREALAANTFQHVYGILNGTCNYILSRMTYEGLEFDSVLQQAQELGFAETPPDLDIQGNDTAHKCQIIASLCYGTEVDVDSIPTEGITSITHADVAYAVEMGYVIKLLAVIGKLDGKLDARVQPMLIPNEHLLASVRNEFNAVYVQSDVADATMYYGRGAGRLPTASAVVGDVADIARAADSSATPPFRYGERVPLVDPGDVSAPYYLRLTTADEPGVLGTIGTILGDAGISVASCIQKDPHGEHAVHLVIMTHAATGAALSEAVTKINALKEVTEETHVIQVLQEQASA